MCVTHVKAILLGGDLVGVSRHDAALRVELSQQANNEEPNPVGVKTMTQHFEWN